jgi:hypothetical protein
MIVYLDKKTYKTAFFHAFCSAFLVDIRILGIIVPGLTVVFFFTDMFLYKTKNTRREVGNFIFYILVVISLTTLFWPFLWEHPLKNFIAAFVNMKSFRWDAPVLYLGNFTSASELPWHYIPVWILITTPILYIILFFIGIIGLVKEAALKHLLGQYIQPTRYSWIFFLWLFAPVIAVIALDSTVYDAWRHVFFVYPAFIIIAIKGLLFLSEFKTKTTGKGIKHFISIGIVAILITGLIEPIHFMIRHHPYQNLYFNRIAGKNMAVIKKRFELDYWGLSYRKALEYIVENDPSKIIKLCVANPAGIYNTYILPNENRNRLLYAPDLKSADYFIGNYRWHPDEYLSIAPFFSIKINKTNIIAVYKLKEPVR